MNNGRLVLKPSDPALPIVSAATILQELSSIGFLGDTFGEDGAQRYLTGERFLQLITFLGCSPHIETSPPTPGSLSFCHIFIEGPFDAPRLLLGKNSTAPRCPSCHSRINDWRGYAEQWTLLPEIPFRCPQCGEEATPIRLDWRRQAGAGRMFIIVEQVFPGEAVPVPELTTALEHASGTPWDHFFLLR